MGFIGSELGSKIGGITGKFIGKKILKIKILGNVLVNWLEKLEALICLLKMGGMYEKQV